MWLIAGFRHPEISPKDSFISREIRSVHRLVHQLQGFSGNDLVPARMTQSFSPDLTFWHSNMGQKAPSKWWTKIIKTWWWIWTKHGSNTTEDTGEIDLQMDTKTGKPSLYKGNYDKKIWTMGFNAIDHLPTGSGLFPSTVMLFR